MCIEFIARHIRRLKPRQIFTTREMLGYGRRSAVDSALHTMVKSGAIFRVARGVFVKDISKKPSFIEIVEAKAKAFKIKVRVHSQTLLRKYRMSSERRRYTFSRVGHSSSFLTIHGRAYLHGVSARKMKLSESAVGQIIHALWHWGRKRCSLGDVNRATQSFGPEERLQLWHFTSIMPAWLTDLCRYRFPENAGQR